MAPLRLITIGFSHYCEKARWALDRAGLEYVEDDHPPLFHWAANLRARARRTVPVLVTPRGVLGESTDILRFADEALPPERRLFPPELRAEVEPLVAEFDRSLGPAVRRAMYHLLMQHPERARRLLASTGRPWERRMVGPLFPLLRTAIVRGLRITPAKAARSRERVDATFAEVAARLEGGERYLVGDRFTAADLTFAALASPALVPREDGPMGALASYPPEIRAYVEGLRATPAGQYALRLYAEERAASRA